MTDRGKFRSRHRDGLRPRKRAEPIMEALNTLPPKLKTIMMRVLFWLNRIGATSEVAATMYAFVSVNGHEIPDIVKHTTLQDSVAWAFSRMTQPQWEQLITITNFRRISSNDWTQLLLSGLDTEIVVDTSDEGLKQIRDAVCTSLFNLAGLGEDGFCSHYYEASEDCDYFRLDLVDIWGDGEMGGPVLSFGDGLYGYADGAGIHPLAWEDIQLWRSDFTALGERLAEIFGCDKHPTELIPAKLLRLGPAEPPIGRRAFRTIYFASEIRDLHDSAFGKIAEKEDYILIVGFADNVIFPESCARRTFVLEDVLNADFTQKDLNNQIASLKKISGLWSETKKAAAEATAR